MALRQNKTLMKRLAIIESLKNQATDSADLVLLDLVGNRNSEVRLAALNGLLERRSQRAKIASRAMASDSSLLVRCTAVEALGTFDDKSDIWRLIRALKDSEWIVRASAASSLASYSNTTVRRALIESLQDESPNVRSYAAVALSENPNEDATNAVVRALELETNDKAKVGLLYNLYRRDVSTSPNLLLDLLKSDEYTVRCNVMDVLSIEIHAKDTVEIRKSVDNLLFSECHPAVREMALNFLKWTHN